LEKQLKDYQQKEIGLNERVKRLEDQLHVYQQKGTRLDHLAQLAIIEINRRNLEPVQQEEQPEEPAPSTLLIVTLQL